MAGDAVDNDDDDDGFRVALARVIEVTGHARFGDLAASRPEYRAAIVAMAAKLDSRVAGPFETAVAGRASASGGRVRAGLLGPCLIAGGAETHGAMLIRHTSPSVCWAGSVSLESGADRGMAREYTSLVPTGWGRRDAQTLADAVDVLITWAVPDLDGILKGRPRRPKTIAVVHSPVESEWGRTVYRETKGADAWVLVSELCRAGLTEDRARSATVILNAPDPDRLKPRRTREQTRQVWGVPADATVLGFLQRMTGEKGCDAILRSAIANPSAWVVAVGDGFLLDELRESVQRAGLRNVVLPGPDDDPGACLAAFDLMICASDYESFGLSLAEAWAMGVPVISTKVGVAALYPGLTRLVPNRPTVADIAAAVKEVLSDREGTRRRVLRAKECVRGQLGVGRFAREWSDLIRGLAGPTAAMDVRAGRDSARRRELLNAVLACPDRGPELPNSELTRLGLTTCCGGGPTRWRCGSGKGSVSGLPTLDDCLNCVAKTGTNPLPSPTA